MALRSASMGSISSITYMYRQVRGMHRHDAIWHAALAGVQTVSVKRRRRYNMLLHPDAHLQSQSLSDDGFLATCGMLAMALDFSMGMPPVAAKRLPSPEGSGPADLTGPDAEALLLLFRALLLSSIPGALISLALTFFSPFLLKPCMLDSKSPRPACGAGVDAFTEIPFDEVEGADGGPGADGGADGGPGAEGGPGADGGSGATGEAAGTLDFWTSGGAIGGAAGGAGGGAEEGAWLEYDVGERSGCTIMTAVLTGTDLISTPAGSDLFNAPALKPRILLNNDVRSPSATGFRDAAGDTGGPGAGGGGGPATAFGDGAGGGAYGARGDWDACKMVAGETFRGDTEATGCAEGACNEDDGAATL